MTKIYMLERKIEELEGEIKYLEDENRRLVAEISNSIFKPDMLDEFVELMKNELDGRFRDDEIAEIMDIVDYVIENVTN